MQATIQTASPGDAEALFSEALGFKDLSARQAFLIKACGGNGSLHDEVNELLAAHDAADRFLPEIPIALGADQPPQIPGFQIQRILGRGGVGDVYQAYDEKLQRPVAIKLLSVGSAQQARPRILEEARKAASLSDPAIVTIYSVHDEGPLPFISMELIEGFPVDRAAENLTFPQKAQILRHIARAISVAHRAGIIHRDLKPENVLLTPALQPKVLDFGIAISFQEAAAAGKLFRGTPAYSSPEQARGEALTPATDVFSFGSLMFKVLTGRHVFSRDSILETLESICAAQPPFPRNVAVGVPEDLQAICMACLAANPTDRPGAEDITVELGRFLAGEPVRVRPALYSDLLRRQISEHSSQVLQWERNGMISAAEKDRLEAVHRRILADEDHWIIDARKISLTQAALYTGSWLVFISAALAVWLAHDQLPGPCKWLVPLFGCLWLAGSGAVAWRKREPMAAASFLAGAVLSTFPTVLSLFKEIGLLSPPPAGVRQLFADYANAQVFCAAAASLAMSTAAWSRLRMTGFAWTTGALAAATYWALLLCWNWLDQPPERMALWLIPLIFFEAAALACEKISRVRWALPFHLLALAALVGTFDVIALEGPTLKMLGLNHPFLNEDRQRYFSIALNGYLFLFLGLVTERARSLDLRRASRALEGLALLHMLGPLYANAAAQRGNPGVAMDVNIYLATACLLLVIGPWRSSWRTLVGGLLGLALGSYLLVDLEIVGKVGLTAAVGILGIATSSAVAWRLFKTSGDQRY